MTVSSFSITPNKIFNEFILEAFETKENTYRIYNYFKDVQKTNLDVLLVELLKRFEENASNKGSITKASIVSTLYDSECDELVSLGIDIDEFMEKSTIFCRKSGILEATYTLNSLVDGLPRLSFTKEFEQVRRLPEEGFYKEVMDKFKGSTTELSVPNAGIKYKAQQAALTYIDDSIIPGFLETSEIAMDISEIKSKPKYEIIDSEYISNFTDFVLEYLRGSGFKNARYVSESTQFENTVMLTFYAG